MYGPICIFFIYYPISILNCILYSHSPIILSTLCKYIKPAIRVDYCRKVRQKEVFSSRSREVQRKERFPHLTLEKNIYFTLCHTLHHYKTLRIIFTLRRIHIVYIIIIFPYCISSATIFPISIIFSSSFFGFSSALLFSISIYCGFTSFYHYASLVVPFCTWLCFFLFSFVLLMWKSLFSADNSFFAVQLYIGISPIILFKNLTLFMCRNLLVRHYYLSYLCLYSLSLCKNKYVS